MHTRPFALLKPCGGGSDLSLIRRRLFFVFVSFVFVFFFFFFFFFFLSAEAAAWAWSVALCAFAGLTRAALLA